jgi:preprotein translocase subunit SecY
MSSFTQNAESGLGAFSRASDLKKRILYTLLILIIYRFGTYVPLPGIDPYSLKEIVEVYWVCLMYLLEVPYKEWQFLHLELCHIYLHLL